MLFVGGIMNDDSPVMDDRSLRDIAAWLTTPASCGVFLSAFDLKRVSQSIGIGVTPLNRRFAVEQLFRSAAIDDNPGPLFAALIAEVAAHQEAYERCDSPHLQPWIDLTRVTMTTLSKMQETWRTARLA
jgi:hypothetical protein